MAPIDSFGAALRRLTPDATSGKTLCSAARREGGGSHCIARMVKSFISNLIRSARSFNDDT
jgi:hypothetical protein